MRTRHLVDAQAVARRFAVSIGTVNRWVRSGAVPCLRPSRRVVRFDLKKLEARIMNQQKGPRRLGGRVAGEYSRHPYPTVESADGNISLDELGVVFAGEALKAEAVAAVAGWLNPALFNDAAADAGLTAEHFDDPVRRFLFWYARACAELNRWPDVREVCDLAQNVGVPLDNDDLFSTLIPPLSFIEADRLDEYIREVIEFARRRELSRELYRKSVELYAGDDVEVVVRPRERRAAPKPLQRAPSQHRPTKRRVICCG